jgi:hypothetical protein
MALRWATGWEHLYDMEAAIDACASGDWQVMTCTEKFSSSVAKHLFIQFTRLPPLQLVSAEVFFERKYSS